MRPTKRSHPQRVLPVEITPMIDVVFLMIIFFMTTTQFAKLTRAEVNLPREQGERDRGAEEAGLILNILQDGSIIVGQRVVNADEMVELVEQHVRTHGNFAKVLLRADRDADTSVLNQVMKRLRQSGIGHARLATEVP